MLDVLASSVNADEVAKTLCPLVGTDQPPRTVVEFDRQKLSRRVKPQLTRVRHIYQMTTAFQ